MRLAVLVPAVLVFTIGTPFCFALAGPKIAERISEISAKEAVCKMLDRDKFAGLADYMLEKKVPEYALKAVEIMALLEAGESSLSKIRGKARALKPSDHETRLWCRDRFEKAVKDSEKTWEELLASCGEEALWRTKRRFCNILLALNPENAAAHAWLGHKKHKGEWMRPFAIEETKKGKTFDSAWGYVTKEEKSKLENGLRPLRGEWIPREKEEKEVRTWDCPVFFETELLTFKSTLPYDAAILNFRVAYNSMREILDGIGDFFRPQPGRRCNVILARNREDEKIVLIRLGKGTDYIDNPSYYEPDGCFVFSRFDCFSEWNTNISEYNPIARDIAYWAMMETKGAGGCSFPGSWAFRGIALLMETNNMEKPVWDRAINRMEEFLSSRDKLPSIAELVEMNDAKLQSTPGAMELAFGLTHFLFHGNDKVFRNALLAYVKDLSLDYPLKDQGAALSLEDPALKEKAVKYMTDGLGISERK